jgi:hypothetical protein
VGGGRDRMGGHKVELLAADPGEAISFFHAFLQTNIKLLIFSHLI